ncbi:hypothetical protein N8Q68_19415 [Enterobacter hormaechei subsp. hoffmannii]|nr:hypothetical protein [Enterobacter hormaechei subsp. hoffmannii]MCU2953948.1 hypothetical protein [Enterobacter hormaechei subsp. hoffmannii]
MAKVLHPNLLMLFAQCIEYPNTKNITRLHYFVTIGDVVSATNIELKVCHDGVLLVSGKSTLPKLNLTFSKLMQEQK